MNSLHSSLTLDDLQYLTPEQELHDLAVFIEVIYERHSDRARTILWGSNYGGTLATWARKKFPHLVDAAWSSSGVFDMHVSTLGLYDALAYSISRVSGYECRNQVQAALRRLDELVTAGDSETIASELNICSVGTLTDPQHVGYMFETFVRFLVQHIESEHTFGVQQMCEQMNVPADQPLRAFGRWLQHTFKRNDECFDVDYAHCVEEASSVELNAASDLRQATYMQCTQSGLLQVTDAVSWIPNRITLEYQLQKCRDILGPEYNERQLEVANAGLKRVYGSLSQKVTNVLYVNGMIDPWFTQGIVYENAEHTVVINIDRK